MSKKIKHENLIDKSIKKLIDLYNKSEFDSAEKSALKLLETYQNQGVIWKILGVVLYAKGNVEHSLMATKKAIILLPNDAELHKNCGAMLSDSGLFEEAILSYKKALKLNPNDAPTLARLAGIQRDLNYLEEAVDNYKKALDIDPDFSEVYNNLGGAFISKNYLKDAEICFRKALEIDSNQSGAAYNLANYLKQNGNIDESTYYFKKTIELDCENADAHFGLASIYKDIGRLDDSIYLLEKVVELNPKYVGAYNNLGILSGQKMQLKDAERYFRNALKINPNYFLSYNNLLFCMSHGDEYTQESYIQEAKRYGDFVSKKITPQIHLPPNSNFKKILKVGFVTGDFCNHVTSRFVKPLLPFFNNNQIELFAYYNNSKSDETTEYFKQYFFKWTEIITLNDDEVVSKIKYDEIDILVDMSGHTSNNRLLVFAYKPAPIQLSWIAYPASSGLKTMDYYLVDSHWAPQGLLENYFVEKLVRLPSAVAFQVATDNTIVVDCPALKNGYITFGSFNRSSKLTQGTLDLWCRVLNEIPNSKMFIGSLPDEASQRKLENEFSKRGVQLERLIFHLRTTTEIAYLELHGEIDLMLDTYPYAGMTVTGSALWMGVPTLTYAWESLAGRGGVVMLGRVNLENDFVANTPDQFVKMAKDWSANIKGLQSLRHQIRERMKNSAKCRPENIAAGLEKAFCIMWERFCDGLAVESFTVPSEIILEQETQTDSSMVFERLESKYQSKPVQMPFIEEQNQLATLYNQGLFLEAVVKAEDLIARFPKDGFAWKALGASLQSLGRLKESLEVKKISVELAPTDAEVHFNLGNAYLEQELFNESIISLRRGLVIDPLSSDAHYNLALALEKVGELKEAEENYLQALNLGSSRTHNNKNISLAELLLKQGELEQAREHCFAALSENSNLSMAYFILGDVCIKQDKWGEAEAYYCEALKINDADLKYNIDNIYSHLGIAYRMQNKLTEAEEANKNSVNFSPINRRFMSEWVFALRQLCHWEKFEFNNIELKKCFESSIIDVIAPFSLLSAETFNPKYLYLAAQQCSNFRYKKQLDIEPLQTNAINLHIKRRIGYLSADFHSHATVYLFAGILENRNKEEFDIYLYSYGLDLNDSSRSRIENACDIFRNVRELTDEAIASQILADEIDILIDLKGYTAGTRLGITALRPAPVIISWLGYPGTLGHERLADYIIGDATVTPLEHAEYYSETLALMPHCYQPNDNKRPIGIAPTRLENDLPENAFVFCTFNQAYKITPDMFDVWCRLLNAIPESVLWLLEPHPAAQENLRREIEARGIESSRLIFAPKMEQTAHLGRLQLADLAVDTFPYTSHTTASDALWAGVPLVTKMGETFASRVAASILNTMDLSELVTTNDEDYFHVALSLAQNPEKLAVIKQKIAEQKQFSPLFDTQKFARDLERLYQTIWDQELKGERKAVVLSAETCDVTQTSQSNRELVKITLDEDVAKFFNDSTSVNNILRAIISGLPK